MIDTLDNDVHKEGSNTIMLNDSLVKTVNSYSKWGKFISITSLILFGLLIILGLYLIIEGISASTYTDHRNAYGSFLNRSNGGVITLLGFFYVVMAALGMYPMIRFYQSCVSGGKAVASASVGEGIYALEKLTQAVKFYGILLIIYLAILFISILISIIGAMAASAY